MERGSSAARDEGSINTRDFTSQPPHPATRWLSQTGGGGRLGGASERGPDPPLTAAGAQLRCRFPPPYSAAVQRADAVPGAGAGPAPWRGCGSRLYEAVRPRRASPPSGIPQLDSAAPPPGTIRREKDPLLPAPPYIGTGSAAPIGCEDRHLSLAASSTATTGSLGSLPIPTVRFSVCVTPRRNCGTATNQRRPPRPMEKQLPTGRLGGRGSRANGKERAGRAGRGSQWAGASSAGAGSGGGPRRWLRGSHDAELLGARLYCPRQRAEPGARHLLPPVSAPSPAAGVPGPARARRAAPARPRLPVSVCCRFPVDAAQRREWIRAVNRVDPRSRQAWRPGPGAILCSRHFAEADFERYGLRRKLRRGAVPSRFPHPVRAGNGRAPLSPPSRAASRRCVVTSPLPSPLAAAGHRPEERVPRPSSEAASPQPPRRGHRRGPQLQPEGAAGSGRGGAAAAGGSAAAAAAAAPCSREMLSCAPAQNGGECPPRAGGEAAAF